MGLAVTKPHQSCLGLATFSRITPKPKLRGPLYILAAGSDLSVNIMNSRFFTLGQLRLSWLCFYDSHFECFVWLYYYFIDIQVNLLIEELVGPLID